jgi:hypothetical protein
VDEMKGLETYKELVEFFMELGCTQEQANKLADKIKVSNYDLIVNPETIRIGTGGQYFGSGGYWHDYKIWTPKNKKLEEVGEIIDKDGYDNGFVSGVWFTIKPTVKPLIISHSRGDCIGNGRRFNAEVFVLF